MWVSMDLINFPTSSPLVLLSCMPSTNIFSDLKRFSTSFILLPSSKMGKWFNRSRRYSDSSSSSSSSESSSSDDEDRESRKSRSKSKRRKKEKKHQSRSRLKQSTSDDEADGPLPLSRFFGSIKS
ncbi:hypothetical protein KY290_011007 [Solanum tuberosum]|uniref:Uncharacterized protein n=1 Tax=Solanum tuberosum TaxID=4113 RepID=A0ABQ7VZW1_SOLTU|nr:hypothetical protein KY290_011007 [Solanum tuberosum]